MVTRQAIVSDQEIVAAERTVAVLGGHRVGIGNIWERTYALPDGSEQRGPTSMLNLPDDTTLTAGRGTELRLAGARWHVVDVSEGRAARGSVTFARESG